MSDYKLSHYQLKKDVSGQWFWIFVSSNNKTIAKSSESYHNRTDCLNGLYLVRDKNTHPVWDMTTSPVTKIA